MILTQLSTHIRRVSPGELRIVEQRIAAALQADGIDPSGLDLDGLPAQVMLRDLIKQASLCGIEPIETARSEPDCDDGHVDMVFRCRNETDATGLKLIF